MTSQGLVRLFRQCRVWEELASFPWLLCWCCCYYNSPEKEHSIQSNRGSPEIKASVCIKRSRLTDNKLNKKLESQVMQTINIKTNKTHSSQKHSLINSKINPNPFSHHYCMQQISMHHKRRESQNIEKKLFY